MIWAPKLEGFAFKTSAENVTSQRGKKKVKNKQEWKRKKIRQALLHKLSVNLQTIILNNQGQNHTLVYKGQGEAKSLKTHVCTHTDRHSNHI